ncbi:FkbM family methyltransferase [Polynucleobacter paneuropaeus]|nr:FkbM family methyltransferase [Polynucleobacter paneuropaeus]
MMQGSTRKNYLDIGANHPTYLSNTALMYKNGGCGILIEPDPYLAKLLRRKRPRDRVIEAGVHFSGEKEADFYVLDSPTLNTFSEEEMMRYVAMGHKLVSKLKVQLIDINLALEMAGNLDFLNIDIEGLDYAVLATIDWNKFRPKCVCVETISYEKTQQPIKLKDIANLMLSQDYMLYADTYINSIFVDRHQWDQHWRNKQPAFEYPIF